MVYVHKTPLGPASPSYAERLATATYNKFMPKIVGPFVIDSAHLNTLTNDEHGIHNMVLIDRAMLTSRNEPAINSSQHLTIEKEHPAKNIMNWENTHPKPTKYAFDQIFSQEVSEDVLCYRVCWYENLPGYSLDPLKRFPKHSIHRSWKGKPHNYRQRRKW